MTKKTSGTMLANYDAMAKAIDQCYKFDECKEILDKSVALAAYYKQVKDEETERKFIVVRLRASRRIAEMFSDVIKELKEQPYDIRGQSYIGITTVRKIKTIRESFSTEALKGMSDDKISQMIKLSTVSNADFEKTLASTKITGSLPNFFENTPEGVENRKSFEAVRDSIEAERQASYSSPEYREKMHAEKLRREHVDELLESAVDAMEEVGVTLERKDRKKQKQFVFLMRRELHDVMRDAAHEHRITMHEVLRQGLKMWLEKHSYKYPVESELEEA